MEVLVKLPSIWSRWIEVKQIVWYASYRQDKMSREIRCLCFGSRFPPPQKPNSKPHRTSWKMSVFATVQRASPWLLLATSRQKSSYKTGARAQLGVRTWRKMLSHAVVPSPWFSTAKASLPHTSVFCLLCHHHYGSWWWWHGNNTPQSSRFKSPMQGKWERNCWCGEALWQGGLDAIWPSQMTKKSWRIWWDTTIINCTVVIAGGFSSFLHIQIIIFKYIWMPAQRCKWQHTTNATKNGKQQPAIFFLFFGRSNPCHHTLSTSMSTHPNSPEPLSSGQHPMLILNRHSISMP